MRLLFVLIWLLSAAAYGQAMLNHADDTAIRELIQKYIDARNNQDAERTRSLFTADADQLVSTGEWRRGIEAVSRGAMRSSQKETGKSSIRVEAIRAVALDVAIADGRYETFTVGTEASRKMWTTLIVKRTDAGWRIAAIRNMLPSPTSSGTIH